jgi:hypothetical protein
MDCGSITAAMPFSSRSRCTVPAAWVAVVGLLGLAALLRRGR